ncbi:hypothetical protein H4Q26_006010 [Puccinia striiformis f. sp. tritici PST-130]|nr:hypothetical protein H4Q26_006010 [Puccinia striiformis f. sp. tritici PST-130]
MDKYITDLKRHINEFMYHLIKSTAQWNRGCLQFLMAGGIVYDQRTGTLNHVSHQVTNLFATHPLLQRSLGYNRDVINHGSAGDFPSVAQSKVREAAVEMVPEDITRFNNAQPRRGEILQVGEIRLSLHDTICSGVFIVVDAFYEMRQISRTTNHAVVNTKDVMGSINVQHNCQFGRCVIRPTKPVQLERQPTNILTPEVGHTDDGHFVINVAVLHNPALHCLVSDLPGQGLTARGWVECVNHGFSVWAQVPDEPADILDTTASEALQ